MNTKPKWALYKRIVINGCDGTPYMIRRRILVTPWFGIYLHHILRSDEDRELHDHPWSFITFILSGGYVEHTPKGAKRYGAGRILYRPAPWPHRLELDRSAWTLVFLGRRKRDWGFYTPSGWMQWWMFLRRKGCE